MGYTPPSPPGTHTKKKKKIKPIKSTSSILVTYLAYVILGILFQTIFPDTYTLYKNMKLWEGLSVVLLGWTFSFLFNYFVINPLYNLAKIKYQERYKGMHLCKLCNGFGSGKLNNSLLECPRCEGRGLVTWLDNISNNSDNPEAAFLRTTSST